MSIFCGTCVVTLAELGVLTALAAGVNFGRHFVNAGSIISAGMLTGSWRLVPGIWSITWTTADGLQQTKQAERHLVIAVAGNFTNSTAHSIWTPAEQETQLSLTNLRDAFIRQSKSPNIVPFHMLDIVSYCAIVTLFWIFVVKRSVLTIFDFKNVVTLKSGTEVIQGHWKWYYSRFSVVSY